MVSCMGTTRFSCTSLAASSGLPVHMTRSDKGPLQTSYYVLSKSRSTPAIQRTTQWWTSNYVGYAHFISILTSLWGAGEPLMRKRALCEYKIVNGAEAYPQERH